MKCVLKAINTYSSAIPRRKMDSKYFYFFSVYFKRKDKNAPRAATCINGFFLHLSLSCCSLSFEVAAFVALKMVQRLTSNI